ncbi:hypothetical protein ACROYT_G041580 [Oculina patagonica]
MLQLTAFRRFGYGLRWESTGKTANIEAHRFHVEKTEHHEKNVLIGLITVFYAILTEDLAAGHANSSSYSQDNRVIQCDILFKQNETIAVKHGRKKEEWGFFLAVLMKDLLIKKGSNDGIDFVDDCMSITWLDNCETGDKYTIKESDCRNSPYSVINRVEVVVNKCLPNEKLYTISQQEVLRIERILKGGVDSDIDSED